MIAILGGLGAATMWAATILCSSRSSRLIGPRSVLAWVMLVGLALVAPFVVLAGIPANLKPGAVALLAIAGLGNVVGLLLEYAALRIGQVAVVAAIASTEGAVAAVLSALTGERVSLSVATILGVITLGVFLVSSSSSPEGVSRREPVSATFFAVAAAICFGVGLFAVGRLSTRLPLVWVLLPARLIGVAAVAAPLAASSRLRLSRQAAPLVVAGGICEVLGFALFAVGSRDSTAVAAVLASQFAGIAAVCGYVLFRERLRPIQVLGIVTTLVGVSVLAALRA
jgi:drug/metabolite transporter (DMT)-like permease